MAMSSLGRGTKGKTRHKTSTLMVIMACQLMVVLDGTVVNIALPHIQSALHFNPADLSWTLNAYILTFGGFLLLGARAGDLLGRRRVLMAGIVIFTVCSLVAGVSTSSAMLLAARAIQGLGGALASPSALALLTTTFKEGRERTRAVAWYTGVSIGGSALGLVLGGIIVEWLSWRWIFFVNLPIGIALVAGAHAVLPETDRHHGRLDVAGAITSTTGMSALVYGLVRAATAGWTDVWTAASFAAGVALITAFVAIETRAEVPIVPLRLLSSRNRSISYLVRMFLVGGSFGQFFFLTQFAQDVLHYSSVETGICFVPLTAMLFVASQTSARVLTGRVPDKVQMLVGLTISAGALGYLTQLSSRSSYPELLTSLLLFGLGNGLAFVPLTNLGLSGVRHDDAGAASGLLNAAQQVGGAVGLALLVSVFGSADKAKSRHLSPHLSAATRFATAFVAGATRAFEVATGLVAACVVLVAVMRFPRRDEVNLSEEELAEVEAATAGLA